MSLFIVDDNVPFRKSLATILTNIEGIEIAGMAGEVTDATRMIRKLKPDTVILDLHILGGNGLDVLKEIKTLKPKPTVIILTVGPKNEYQNTSYMAGADYFFEKSSDVEKMIELLEDSVGKR